MRLKTESMGCILLYKLYNSGKNLTLIKCK